MTDNTDGFDTGIGIEEETGPESGMPSEGPDCSTGIRETCLLRRVWPRSR